MLLPCKPALVVALLASLLTAPPAGAATTEVSFTGGGGVTLHGTIVAPARERGRAPGIVMVHGAGPVTRAEYRDEAEAYARRGIATLIYDKRTSGYSTVDRDYDTLADDALAAVHALRGRPEVNPEKVGIWGLSEGAWVAPLAAVRSPEVAFLVVAGAIGTTPARQQSWAYGQRLAHAGVQGSLVTTMRHRLIRFAQAAGLFAEAAHDPVASWERVRQPVLAVWGALDREAMPAESARIIRRALERGGNDHHTIRSIPGVRHNLNGTHDNGFDRPDLLPATYAELEATWIKSLPARQRPDTPPHRPATGAPPSEPTTWHKPPGPPDQAATGAPPSEPIAWYEAPGLQIAALLIFLVALLGHLAVAVGRGLRGRRGAAPGTRPARWFLIGLLTTVLGFLSYLGVQVVTGAYLIGPVILGRPLPWLALQLTAVATVAAAVRTALATWPARPADRARRALTLTAAAAFVPWTLYWGLIIP
ncbi:alpha/beta hydrolase [Spongiactinospora rosea]|uniref:Alpha/beta hydrolase n=1 Tax=Spongiactinospora rosea TaxID=2248750 RepID=A0A366LVF4_9ACTN|nr:CocE/NonD family hydrolase [Spongiactinospora rosea]RBQ17935.1 alpha/beta hydrolase [Spongiactinospora rosea]